MTEQEDREFYGDMYHLYLKNKKMLEDNELIKDEPPRE